MLLLSSHFFVSDAPCCSLCALVSCYSGMINLILYVKKPK